MARLFVLILLVDLALVAMALIECLSAEETAIRGLPRVGWIFAILLFGPVGALAWFVAGRPMAEFRITRSDFPARPRPVRTAHPTGSARPARPVLPAGPDDDPEFLRGLAEAIKAQQARES